MELIPRTFWQNNVGQNNKELDLEIHDFADPHFVFLRAILTGD